MAMRRRYSVVLLLLFLLMAAAVSVFFFNTSLQAPKVSTLSIVGEGIEILRSGQRAANLLPDNTLGINDRVSTRANGADIMCSDGTRIHLGPLTDIMIDLDPNGIQRITMSMGAMRFSSTATALGMLIGTPFGTFRTPRAAVTVLDVSVSQGAYVRVGSIDIARNQSLTHVTAGNQFTIDGLLLPIGSGEPPTLQEIVLNLTKVPEQQVAPGAPLPLNLIPKHGARFAPQGLELKVPSSPQALLQNDRVHTDGSGSTIVAGRWGRYLLDENSDIVVVRSTQAKHKRDANVSLQINQGGLTLVAPTKDNEVLTTSVLGAAQEAQMTSGLMMAQARVAKDDDGLAVQLRFGRLEAGGKSVEAGHTVRLREDRVEVGPLSPTAVPVTPDKTTIVHYPERVPAIDFIWSQDHTHRGMDLEIATEPAFLDVPFAETVKQGHFIVDQLESRRIWYWRVGGAEAAAHQLQFQSETPECASCVPPDVISDAVPHTVIEFDESITQVAFVWRSFAGAKYYLFRLYNDGQFDKPVLIQHVNEPNYLLAPGRLAPGTYFWNAVAYNDDGVLLHKGELSDFEMQEPDGRPPLSIEFPKEAAVVKQDKLVTTGQAPRGAKVSCNGVELPTDAAGQFSRAIALEQGDNFLVYKVELNARMRHFYTRRVIRL